ncbi:MAG: hypothetical protein N4A43_02390 [Alphaproteobacteria bacterium]|jgi:hypothetical protein|nr:hypothetical protein [Alphaproteobacteria bacterium]
MHPRQQIREAVANRLKEVNTKAKNRVFTSRAKPIFDQDMPAIIIYTNEENIKQERWDTDGFGALTRELDIFIEAIDKGKEELDDNLDALALEIENALDGWEIPNRKSSVLKFTGTDMDMSIDGKSIYGAIRLSFSLNYRTKTKTN